MPYCQNDTVTSKSSILIISKGHVYQFKLVKAVWNLMPINKKAKTQMIVLALIKILAIDDYFKTALTSIFYNSKHFCWWTPKSKNLF